MYVMDLHPFITSSGDVMLIRIVRIGDPVCGRRDVVVLETGARFHENGQVVLEHVADLNTVLQEETTYRER